ncbi:hypothetical protein MAMC_01594 [Methylacidimicrobium cyclopophantes]|uniref:Uncharacterized protein n=1 Tax=Methylacidimicrobium cyclopophantes TaxID=1041766 RepID=A0A5E6MEN4_9BACT|nr:hypothetical protein [Methylacidimicrobium cyclopophantes]VVM07435.1 hypothetical protein MAMC_01594 [Methylacidimicrobium cyclopophantes]
MTVDDSFASGEFRTATHPFRDAAAFLREAACLSFVRDRFWPDRQVVPAKKRSSGFGSRVVAGLKPG